MTKNPSTSRKFIEKLIQNSILTELRERDDRDDDWCHEVELNDGVVFSLSLELSDTSQKKFYLSSDNELAHFLLTHHLGGFKMQLETQGFSAESNDSLVTKLLVSEVQTTKTTALKFFCQIGERYFGFDGEISPLSISTYKCKPFVKQPV